VYFIAKNNLTSTRFFLATCRNFQKQGYLVFARDGARPNFELDSELKHQAVGGRAPTPPPPARHTIRSLIAPSILHKAAPLMQATHAAFRFHTVSKVQHE
jgi:hypothetical protein